MWKMEAGRSPSKMRAPILKAAFTSASFTGISIWSGFLEVDMSRFLSRVDIGITPCRTQTVLHGTVPPPSRSLHAPDRFFGRPHGMGEKSKVDHRRLVTVAPNWMPRAGGRVLDDGDLEAPFKQLPQGRFDAYVRQHPAENDLIDPPFAQLQHQIVGLRPPYFVRADYDRLRVVAVCPEAAEPVTA